MFLNARGGPFGGKVDVRLNHTALLARRFTRNNFSGEKTMQFKELESTVDGCYRVEVSAPSRQYPASAHFVGLMALQT
jgi:hypothetical protein